MSSRSSRQMRERLTNSRVQRLKPGAGDYAVHDNAIEGLAIRIQPSGTKSWIFRRTLDGRLGRITLGRFPLMGVAEARAAAAVARFGGQAALPDIGGVRRRTPLFSDFAHEFMTKRAVHMWRPTTMRSRSVYLRHTLIPAFGDTPIGDITHQQVAAWFYEYGRKAPGGANMARWLLHAIFKAAVDWGHISDAAAIPTRGVKKHKRPKAGRPLTAKELKRFGDELAAYDRYAQPGVQAIKLILLTGCRASEILTLQWSDWQGDRLSVSGKTGKRVVFLGKEATGHLERIRDLRLRREQGGTSGYIFPSSADPSKPMKTVRAVWKSILADADIPTTLRLQDLRHTFASISVSNGESLQVTGLMLGHKRIGSTERYAHLDDKHIRAANQRISNAIERAVLSGC